jgi:hypothetical protein
MSGAVLHDAALAVISLAGLVAVIAGFTLPVLYVRAGRAAEYEEVNPCPRGNPSTSTPT